MDNIYPLVRQTVSTYITPYATGLRTTWYALAIVSCSILASGRLKASFGRHYTKSSIFPAVNGKLAWMVMEIWSPIMAALFFNAYKAAGPPVSTGRVLYGLWLLHYANRAVISPFLSPRMASSRLDIVVMSAFFNCVNGAWVGHDLGVLNSQEFMLSQKVLVGLALFFVGWTINLSSDYHLQSARRKSRSDEYILPEWGLYKYIVSPNYAGETVEWIGYSVILGMESGWQFVIWTICNIWPRARTNLVWYREKFGTKVGNRKAIVPGVF